MSKNVHTPEFRVSFPKVFEAELNKLSKKMEYSVIALFKKGTDLSVLKKAAEEALTEKFGADKSKWPKNLRSPFRDQSEKVVKKKGTEEIVIDPQTGKPQLQAGCEEGAIFINLKSNTRPGVVDQNVKQIIDQNEFYAGCWAHATVRAYYYDQAGNKGVAFGLQNVQKLRDGEPLGGRVSADVEFAPVSTSEAKSNSESESELWG